MIRITENEIMILKKYMPIDEIIKRYDIVPMEDIERVVSTPALSIKHMAQCLELPYDRVYYYVRKYRNGLPFKHKEKYTISKETIEKAFTYFQTHEKENGYKWTLQDLAIYLSDDLPDIPSINFLCVLLKKYNLSWKENK